MKPELLAPAGSIDSFHAAIEAGADAVYLGLTGFNARLRARNFTCQTLSYLVPYAHERRVRVYVTLNTLVKQAELAPLVTTLCQLEQIGVDAIIVTDPGVIELVRSHFPRLTLHASTQMTVHNSAGANALERLGVKRVILARELSIDEIRAIRRQSRIELEVFIHGALCYSVSGLCLASSFLGGSSGNRGRCTQVCRRPFTNVSGPGSGYFFSPRDLCAIDFLPQLTDLGIASFKIEGRMKSASYVYSVVKAYRGVLDGAINVEKAKKLLEDDLGREKTVLFLSGVCQRGIIEAFGRAGIGRFVGTVVEASGDTIVIAAEWPLSIGDRIRVQPQSGFEGESAEVASVVIDKGNYRIACSRAVSAQKGDALFLIGRRSDDARFSRPPKVSGVEPARFDRQCSSVRKILKQYEKTIQAQQHQRTLLWVKIDSVIWLDHVGNTPCQRLLFAGNPDQMESLLADADSIRQWKSRLVICLPPFIPEGELEQWRSLINRFRKSGVDKGACSNIGHALLFPKEFDLIADAAIGSLNAISQTALMKQGFSRFVYSYEDDYLNIKAAASGRGIACLFSRVSLFISRVHPIVRTGEQFVDSEKTEYEVAEANGCWYLLPQQPFCLTHRRDKLAQLDITNFLIDLSFCNVNSDFLRTIMECYQKQTRLPGSSLFNFKAGLK